MLSFEWLIDPITPETFFKEYYEQKPLLIRGKDPARSASLLSVEVIDRYLAGRCRAIRTCSWSMQPAS
jgi:ribosomal protein L16 Arg81 hydroxylase